MPSCRSNRVASRHFVFGKDHDHGSFSQSVNTGFTTNAFTVVAGNHTISYQGLDPDGGYWSVRGKDNRGC